MNLKRIILLLLTILLLSSQIIANEPATGITLSVSRHFTDSLVLSGSSKLEKGERIGLIFQDEFTRSPYVNLMGSALTVEDGNFSHHLSLPKDFTPGIYRIIARQYEGPFLNPTGNEGLFKLNNMMVRLHKMPEGSTTYLIGNGDDVRTQINQIREEMQKYGQIGKDIQKVAKKINRGKKLNVYGLPDFMGIQQRGTRGRFLIEISRDQRAIRGSLNGLSIKPLNDNVSDQIFKLEMLMKSLDIEFASRGLNKTGNGKLGVKDIQKQLNLLKSEYKSSLKAIDKRIKSYEKTIIVGGRDDDGDEKAKNQVSENTYPFRTWRDSSGQYEVVATFVELEEDSITIMQENGNQITLPVLKLSNADQVYVQKITRSKN